MENRGNDNPSTADIKEAQRLFAHGASLRQILSCFSDRPSAYHFLAREYEQRFSADAATSENDHASGPRQILRLTWIAHCQTTTPGNVIEALFAIFLAAFAHLKVTPNTSNDSQKPSFAVQTYHPVSRRAAMWIRAGRWLQPIFQVVLGVIAALTGLTGIVTLVFALSKTLFHYPGLEDGELWQFWLVAVCAVPLVVVAFGLFRLKGLLNLVPRDIRRAVHKPFHLLDIQILGR